MPRRLFRLSRQRWLRLFFVLNLALVAGLIIHQVWLYVAEPEFESLHTVEVAEVRDRLAGRDAYRFAVVGNINNSVNVFQDEIVPLLNQGDIDFMVSAGNAVSGGQQESYQAIYHSLELLDMPYLLTYGDNEDSDFGSYLFYDYFGPHFYAFVAGNSHFIFLDGTGKSSTSWQLDWLERELAASDAAHRFVFVGLPLHNVIQDAPLFEEDNYLNDPRLAEGIMRLAERYGVDTVFSANLSLYAQQTVNGVTYVTTGGAGGLLAGGDDTLHEIGGRPFRQRARDVYRRDRIAICVHDGKAGGDFARQDLADGQRISVRAGLGDPGHDLVHVRDRMGREGTPVRRLDDGPRTIRRQARQHGPPARGAETRHAVAHQRGVQGLAFGLQTDGVDHAGIVEQRQIHPFAHRCAQFLQDRRRQPHQRVEPQIVQRMIQQAYSRQESVSVGIAANVAQHAKGMDHALRRRAVDPGALGDLGQRQRAIRVVKGRQHRHRLFHRLHEQRAGPRRVGQVAPSGFCPRRISGHVLSFVTALLT